MKKSVLIIMLLWLPLILAAQISLPVEDTRRVMSKGDQPGFLVRIPEASISVAEKSWMREIRKGSKAKPSKSREEISIEGAIVGSIRSDAMNIYTRFYQDGKDLLMYSFFEVDSVFLDGSKNLDISGNIRNFIREFAIKTYRDAYAKNVAAEEKVLNGMEKSYQSMESSNKKSERYISKNERSISDLQQSIKEISGDEERKAIEIDRQKNLITTLVNFPEEQKAANSKLKSLEKERRRMKKNRESSHKRIDKLDEGIKNARRNIRINEEKMRQQSKEIELQRSKVLEMNAKLSSIR